MPQNQTLKSMTMVRSRAITLLRGHPFAVVPLNREDTVCRRVRLVDAWLTVYYVNAETIEDMETNLQNILPYLHGYVGISYRVF